MDKYPLLLVVTLASVIGPLLIVGWWMYGWQRKAPPQWHDWAAGKPADSQRHDPDEVFNTHNASHIDSGRSR
jgi:hypothetical protein